MVERYGYAHITKSMVRALTGFAKGHRILDLGCGGDAPLSKLLLNLGASHVVGIDKKPIWFRHEAFTRIESLFSQLEAYETLPKRVLLSWPTNHPGFSDVHFIPEFLKKAEEICYIGANDHFTVCGWDQLWHVLRLRRVLQHHSTDQNHLVHYGEPLRRQHPRLPGEGPPPKWKPTKEPLEIPALVP